MSLIDILNLPLESETGPSLVKIEAYLNKDIKEAITELSYAHCSYNIAKCYTEILKEITPYIAELKLEKYINHLPTYKKCLI